jgi:DNA polymerase I
MKFINCPGKDFTEALTYLKNCKILGVDTETTGINPYTSRVLILTLGTQYQQYVFDVARLQLAEITPLKAILESPKVLKLVQNAKFDYKMLKQDMNIVLDNIYDTMIVEQILTRGKKSAGSGLDDLVEKYVGTEMSKTIRKTFAVMQFGDTFTKEQIEYAANDVKYLEAIRTSQLKIVKKYKLDQVIELENNAVAPTGDMELNGIYLDSQKWLALQDIAIADRENARNILDTHFIPIVGKDLLGAADINYNSPAQVMDALNRILPHAITTTKEEYLKSVNHPAVTALLDYREKQKQITTYGSAFLLNIDSKTRRIHPNFLQVMGTDSGRYSCQDPYNIRGL